MEAVANMIVLDYLRYKQSIQSIAEELQQLPKGNLAFRESRGRPYCHLQYRSTDGVHNDRVPDIEIDTMRNLLNHRDTLKKTEKQLQCCIKALEKIFPQLLSTNIPTLDTQQNISSDSEKPYLTVKGDFVRSKSEVIIANELHNNHISYEYEKPLLLEGYQRSFLPDFTIYTSNTKQIIYWEHCGLMDNDAYRAKWNWKKQIYELSGISEWCRNLIVTYESSTNGLQLEEILQKIAWLKKL